MNGFFTFDIVLLVLNETNKEFSEGVKITNMQQGGWASANNPSTTSGINVDTGDSASIIYLHNMVKHQAHF